MTKSNPDNAAAQAGRELADPNTMNEKAHEDDSHKPIAQAINGMSMMDARRHTLHGYVVTSWRNNNKSGHCVDLNALKCTCEDYDNNCEGQEVCDHIMLANHVADHIEEDAALNYHLQDRINDLEDITARLERKTTGLQADEAHEAADDGADSEDQDASPVEDTRGEDALEAAHRLQEAYGGVVEDMQVTANAGLVWIQTGKDTPDELPFPGSPGTFDTLLKDPEHVTFVHDDHEYASKKPGEWWKNAIRPSEVDDYIEEVLE